MRFRRNGLTLEVFAPAKVNLTLDVRGRRADGFHELESLFVSVGWYDTLTFTPAEALSLTIDGNAELAAEPDNLVLRAARLFADAAGIEPRVAVRLTKRIPAQAGLGGGSSDAAATLAAMNTWSKAGVPDAKEHPGRFAAPELLRLGEGLGSDVPFFLSGHAAAVCRGRGERIEPVSAPPLHLVIQKPPVGLSTAAVFGRLDRFTAGGRTAGAAAALSRGDVGRLGDLLGNDLEVPAAACEPSIAATADDFARCGLPRSIMSGSGTARVAVCRSRREASVAASRLRALGTGETAAVTTAL